LPKPQGCRQLLFIPQVGKEDIDEQKKFGETEDAIQKLECQDTHWQTVSKD